MEAYCKICPYSHWKILPCSIISTFDYICNCHNIILFDKSK